MSMIVGLCFTSTRFRVETGRRKLAFGATHLYTEVAFPMPSGKSHYRSIFPILFNMFFFRVGCLQNSHIFNVRSLAFAFKRYLDVLVASLCLVAFPFTSKRSTRRLPRVFNLLVHGPPVQGTNSKKEKCPIKEKTRS